MSLLAASALGYAGNYPATGKTRGAAPGLAGLVISSAGLSAFAGLLYKIGITSLFGGYVFAFALLGLRWPGRLLEVFVFSVALGHRDFTYVAMNLGGGPAGEAKLFITEWVLLILVVTAVPGVWRLLKRFDAGMILLGGFLVTGSAILFMTFGDWPPSASLRDFALVYYSLFAVTVMAHARDVRGVRRIAIALLLGTVPNLAGDVLNYLYGTLPMTAAQKNYSMRNSYYYLVALGFLLPFVLREDGKPKVFRALYAIIVYVVVLLYSYSKTAMIAAMVLTALYFFPRLRQTRVAILAVVAVLLVLPIFLTPKTKVFYFHTLFSESTYLTNSRSLLQYAAMRDFSEYPYGIGFGSPIFGQHSHELIRDVDSFHAIHNSYLTVLRRMGIGGGAVFLVLIAAAFYGAVRISRLLLPGSRERKMVLGTVLASTASLIFAYAHVVLEGPFLGSIFWCLVGSMFAVGRYELFNEKSAAFEVGRGER